MPLGAAIGLSGIEICSSEPDKPERGAKQAYTFWRKLLDEGKKLGAFYGRDWHGKINYKPMYTYIGASEFTKTAVIDGIRANRNFISSRDIVPEISLQSNGSQFFYGDTVSGNQIEIVSSDKSLILSGKNFGASANFTGSLQAGYYFIESADRDFITSPFYVR
jgi:hypothetical protein